MTMVKAPSPPPTPPAIAFLREPFLSELVAAAWGEGEVCADGLLVVVGLCELEVNEVTVEDPPTEVDFGNTVADGSLER